MVYRAGLFKEIDELVGGGLTEGGYGFAEATDKLNR
jgi:hypothetical protein